MKMTSMLGATALLVLLPATAYGQAPLQPRSAASAPIPSRTGVTLADFTARHERRMLAADTDGDGKVSKVEFMAMARSGAQDPGRRFARLDGNGDGMIDRPEIAAVTSRQFARQDADRDGTLTPVERQAVKSRRQRGPTAS